MPTTTGIRNVKVADPGVSFILDLEDSLFGSGNLYLKVNIYVLKEMENQDAQHITSVYISGPQPLRNSASGFFIVAPFGCNDYSAQAADNAGVCIRVDVLKSTVSPDSVYSLWKSLYPVTAESGTFSISIN